MIQTCPRQVECHGEIALVCDRCGREVTPDEHSEWNEALRLRLTNGYGSVFGGGARVEADLCQHCGKELRPFLPCLARAGASNDTRPTARFLQSCILNAYLHDVAAYLPRTLGPVLRKTAREFPAAVLTGPHQSGETTLLRHAFGGS